MPGTVEDNVYYLVRRTINGSTKRYWEKFAQETQCTGRAEARCADAHIVYNGISTTVITGLAHLEGQSVVVWGWNNSDTSGRDLGTYTVSSGFITLSEAVQNACVGLAYTAKWKSAKLAYAAASTVTTQNTALTQKKRVVSLGLILRNTHSQGLQFGQSFDTMDPLPLMYQGAAVSATNLVYDDFDEPMIEVPGEWTTDARLCLQASAPRPCTMLGAVVSVSTNDKTG